MAKYIDREALVEWLKRVPLKDLSDGLGLCRVIMEDDFKKSNKENAERHYCRCCPGGSLQRLQTSSMLQFHTVSWGRWVLQLRRI